MVVLDSWALLAYLRDEPAAELIGAEWLENGAAVCSVNLGEALYIRIRARGEKAAGEEVETIRKHAQVVEADWDLVWAAARVKAVGGMAYADAFCVAAARRLAVPLWTGDPEIVERATELDCEVFDLRGVG